ncbi:MULTISPECIES: LPS export ABC transporter periplasmic protein LptC [unclassified Brenneria]|uniref:LPS export ABC transporter periplasmic protein LptC n=1 Tax=unclassified Brenneria TaxID=2634434 RepID=UPI001554E89D|nr:MULTISPECIES: LPS export ABC transporter periplasmic protein LptC [unclassified Brenneria]MBJ7222482.1 LPS export ABC transporter periplasmic protein LptC [Brenneria sp. L3-3C-1]MEE3643725.1 LPS export ABC transporter periplasmic protein LptC [Brenneria sp. L3_3C_1]MEE3651453.1 LPS export ABC transporter periplasmic protein LptC [Brenneria sp. HEZEL_4_2_4]NPD01409.1 LPS export ABC transporter periplasmic protein LptC [Brenneria sp. hezel4-2-4]
MSKTKRWLTALLALLALILIGWNVADQEGQSPPEQQDTAVPVYTSEKTTTQVYSPAGKLSYRLVSDKAEYFSDEQLSWFTTPVATLFNEQGTATWSVRADRAKLTKDRMLYLYGHVEVNSLTNDSQLERIKTDNAQVNLVTQDVSSDDEVTLYGASFTSNGMKMRGNLREKTAELIEKVKTSYEIQNK